MIISTMRWTRECRWELPAASPFRGRARERSATARDIDTSWKKVTIINENAQPENAVARNVREMTNFLRVPRQCSDKRILSENVPYFYPPSPRPPTNHAKPDPRLASSPSRPLWIPIINACWILSSLPGNFVVPMQECESMACAILLLFLYTFSNLD